MSARPIILSWSGGKDSAWMLDRLLRQPEWHVVGLLTMVTSGDRRTCMHHVPYELLAAQAEAVQLPLVAVEVPPWPSNDVYTTAFTKGVDRFRSQGVQTVAFGDLFLSDIRSFRETLCQRQEIEPLFPLWGLPTDRLADDFLDAGYRAIVCCCDGEHLTAEFAGSYYDADFLTRLPAGVDPCGERGEFHTFVFDGPCFRTPVPVTAGDTTRVDRFWYTELLATAAANCSVE